MSSLQRKQVPCVIFSAIIIKFPRKSVTEGRTHTEFLGRCISTRTRNKIPSASPPRLAFPLLSVGTRPPVAERSLRNFRLVAYHVHCEISRSGDTYTSFWWHTSYPVRNSVSSIVHFR